MDFPSAKLAESLYFMYLMDFSAVQRKNENVEIFIFVPRSMIN